MTPERTDDVLVESRAGVCTITLNRPGRLNAFTLEMEHVYLRALSAAGSDDAVRVIIVTGAGAGFCAGADFDVLKLLTPAAASAQRESAGPLQISLGIDKPVIAAINGVAAGIGLAHALMADLRFASSTARFVSAFSGLGLAAEAGTAWLLPRLVGTSRALDLLWSGRAVDAEEAKRIGLVDEVLAPEQLLAHAQAYAANLVECTSSFSLASMKRQVYAGWNQTVPEAFELADDLVTQSVGRTEFASSVSLRHPSGKGR